MQHRIVDYSDDDLRIVITSPFVVNSIKEEAECEIVRRKSEDGEVRSSLSSLLDASSEWWLDLYSYTSLSEVHWDYGTGSSLVSFTKDTKMGEYDDWVAAKALHDNGHCNAIDCEFCYEELSNEQKKEFDKEHEGEIPF